MHRVSLNIDHSAFLLAAKEHSFLPSNIQFSNFKHTGEAELPTT